MNRLITAIFLLFCQASLANQSIDSLLVELDNLMADRTEIDALKEQDISEILELKQLEGVDEEQLYAINLKLITRYEKYIFDSAFYYLNENLDLSEQLNNQQYRFETRLSLAELLATSGRYKESSDVLSSIPAHSISKDRVIDYYKVSRNIYSVLSFQAILQENKVYYNRVFERYTDSLLSNVAKESEAYYAVLETQLRDQRSMEECLSINTKRLSLTEIGTQTYSLITFERAIAYDMIGDIDNAKRYFIRSAMSDIQLSVKDNASLAALAKILYEENQVIKAHAYINYSFEDANFYNSELRYTQLSNVLPIINDAYEIRMDKQEKIVRGFLLVISILSFILLVAIILVYKQMKNVSKARNALKTVNGKLRELNDNLSSANHSLHETHNDLSEANKVKELYIGNFLTICSEYIDKLDKYRRMVHKHISNKQIEELFIRTKSSELIDDETRAFYQTFDETFLHIYPNFVKRINELLAGDEQIELKKDELLNTELRIFALIRLGINDSPKIAELLRYSVRTIYNYRVKIKNKAIVPRDDFEEYVLKIGAFSE